MQGIEAARSATAHYDDPDVVIVGAGASGAAVAWSLASAGFRVVCLEQGDWVNPQTLPHYQTDWELHRLTDFNADPNVRGRPEDYPVNETASTFSPLMFNAVGGSTIHWSAHFPRYHPSDFRVRSLDGDGDDWPLSYDELEPFYDLNDRMIGIAGRNGDPSQPPRSARQTPPIPLGPLGEAMARGFEQLNWHWWPSDTANITAPFGTAGLQQLRPLRRRAARPGARSSADVTYWPLHWGSASSCGPAACVREITVDQQGRRAALYYDASGALQEQRAPLVIIAANGIGTPRLLLNSRSRIAPDGLANQADGRQMPDVPPVRDGQRSSLPDSVASFQGRSAARSSATSSTRRTPPRDFVRGFMMQIVRETAAQRGARRGHEHPRAMGIEPPRRVRRTIRARRQHGADGRRPPRDGERGDARPDVDGQRRHPIAARALPPERE